MSFCSNDYLGLADLRPPGPAGAALAPSGAASSRLVCGEMDAHREVERSFARFVGFEDAILFPSGFQANVGVPASLLRPSDTVYSDALNHASLIDGLRLAPATRRILDHLASPPEASEASWWFVESVFSMDGDGPGLEQLDAHLGRGGCVYLDEAHAIGLHAGGRGRAAALRHRPSVLVAPLGKAFGCAGAFVCASATVCAWIRGHARGFVFTTAVSPVLVPRINHALELVAGPEGERRRERLWRNVELFRARLGGHVDADGASPIFPVLVGDDRRALALSAALLERGWHVQAIRPPTVPENGARLRITISAAHEPETVERFAAELCQLLEQAPGRGAA
ncbi:aminotransferase class I/II-fold pyridoxal phosphate-dependent enzyme [Enhygromyxa salina]|uniref:aminotransferase class I/II-fold pyridoxal phosphate-dependent enzyme n=1 Tax=Enhygromyxa salina TaxID=215803 RepID=UPI00215986CD|nr:aminotransferase class I/II-fold pyridoxal phosphate-dependent enzyme [Enhygromyxa salina]